MNLPPGLGGYHEEEKESIPKPTQRLKTKDGRRTFEYHEDEEDDFALIHQSDTVSETLIGKKERDLLRCALHRYVFSFLFSYRKRNEYAKQRRETSFRNDRETLRSSSRPQHLELYRNYGCIDSCIQS